MHERCLMLRPRMQTSSLQAGLDVGTPCMTSCRVPVTRRGESCPSPCPCPSCTSTQEEEMVTILRTARAPRPPQPTGILSRGTVNLPHTPSGGPRWFPLTVMKPFLQMGLAGRV